MLLPAAESLVTELARHTGTLGLNAASQRLATARAAANLLNLLAGLTDATALLRGLAHADLPREDVIYRASLTSARRLADQIAALRWDLLDRTAALAGHAGPDAERASLIAERLRSVAQRDEHEIALGDALRAADTAATGLLLDLTGRGAQPDGDDGSSGAAADMPSERPRAEVGGPAREPAGATADSATAATEAAGVAVRRRASGSQVRGVVAELLDEAEGRPDAVFDITWRIVAS